MEPITIPHVKCIGCGKLVADMQKRFLEALNRGLSRKDALREARITSWCCIRAVTSPFVLPLRSKFPYHEEEVKGINMITTQTIIQSSSKPKGIISRIKYPDVPNVPLEEALRGLKPEAEEEEEEPRVGWIYTSR